MAELVSTAPHPPSPITSPYLLTDLFAYSFGGKIYAYQKLMEGDVRKLSRKLPFEMRLAIARDTARAVAALHEAGYYHADFHAGNVLYTTHEAPYARIGDLTLMKANGPRDVGIKENNARLGSILKEILGELSKDSQPAQMIEQLCRYPTTRHSPWIYSAAEVAEILENHTI